MPYIKTKTTGHILEICVDRAEKMNALNTTMYHELGRALGSLDADPELRVAVLYANGKHFTAGIELDEMAPHVAGGKGLPVLEGEIDLFGLTGPQRRKPVVMAVQGYCFTWGVESLLNMEVRVAAEDTQFQMLEVQRGLFPFGGAALRLPQQMGWANAHRYLLTGDRWSAAEAYRTGLVQQVVPVGQQYEAAMKLAESIARSAPLGVQGVVKLCKFALDNSQERFVEQMWADLKPVMDSEDAKEGIRSFMERRQAKFRGC